MAGGLSSSPHNPLPGLLQYPHNQSRQPMKASGNHNAIYDPASKAICHLLHCVLFITCVKNHWVHPGGQYDSVDSEGATEYSIAPNENILGSAQPVGGLVSPWCMAGAFFQHCLRSSFLLGTVPPIHSHLGNHSRLLCPSLTNHGLLVQHQATDQSEGR